MGILGGRREYHSRFLLHFPHSDHVGVVRARVYIGIGISWRHLLTSYAAAILNTGLMPKTPSPTWNGLKLSTRRLVTI
jgi:hypothetical protein